LNDFIKKLVDFRITAREAAFLVLLPALSSAAAAFMVSVYLAAGAGQAVVVIISGFLIGAAAGFGAAHHVDHKVRADEKLLKENAGRPADVRFSFYITSAAARLAVGACEEMRTDAHKKLSAVKSSVLDINSRITTAAVENEALVKRMKEAGLEIKANSENVRKVTTIVNNLSVALKRVIEDVKAISEKTKTAFGVAKTGTKTTGAQIAAMGSIRSAVTESADVINRLQVNSKETKKIVSSIAEIAKKTNLLSLNAGIEAARAGEAGKSFAVVAQQVRELAEAATAATRDMSRFLTGTEELAKEAVNVIKGQSRIEDAVSVVYEASDYFMNIVNSLSEIAKMLADIYSAAEEYKTDNDLLIILSGRINSRLAEITSAINNVFDSVRQSMYIMDEISAGVCQINKDAGG